MGVKRIRYGKWCLCIVLWGICFLPFVISQQSAAKVGQGSLSESVQFHYDSQGKTLEISEKATEIRKETLWVHAILERVTVSADNKNYSSQDGVLYNKDQTCLLYYPPGKDDRSFTVPDSVREIEDLAFHGNEYLRRVTLPAGLEKLGAGCFYACINLEETNIAELHQLREIRDYHKESDIEIYIPFEDGDFNESRYRDYLRYQNNDSERNPDVGYLAYYNGIYGFEDENAFIDRKYFGTFERTNISSFAMPDQLEYVASETFRECVPLHTFRIGKSYRGQINQSEFSQRALSLYYLEIHDLKVHSENEAYILKDNLLYTRDGKTLCQVVCDLEYAQETLHIPEEVICIADGAFYMDALYQNIVVDGDLEEIGISAFAGSEIESFVAKGRIGRLKKGAFMRCEYMTDWECQEGVASMEKKVFHEDTSLERAETGGIFSWLQFIRKRISLGNLAILPAWASILFS